MIRGLLRISLLGAVAALLSAGPASAGGCCRCWAPAPCVAPAPVALVAPVTPVYVVNQGPVYAGPAIVTYPAVAVAPAPVFYPYVTIDYAYPMWRVWGPRYRHVNRGYHHRSYRAPLDPRDK